MNARNLIIAVSMALTAPAVAHAHDDQHKKKDTHKAAATAAAPSAGMTDGEIRNVDKDAKKITIKHGPIQNLDMPPMTMVFQVKDPAMLETVKAGDKVNVAAEKVGGQITVTRIEASK